MLVFLTRLSVQETGAGGLPGGGGVLLSRIQR